MQYLKLIVLILVSAVPSLTLASQNGGQAGAWVVDLHFLSKSKGSPFLSEFWAHVRQGHETLGFNNFHSEGEKFEIKAIGLEKGASDVFQGKFQKTFYQCRSFDYVFRSPKKKSNADCFKSSSQYMEASFRSNGRISELEFYLGGKKVGKTSFVEAAMRGLVGTGSLRDEVKMKGLVDHADPCGSIRKINSVAKDLNLPALQWESFNRHGPNLERFFGCEQLWTGQK